MECERLSRSKRQPGIVDKLNQSKEKGKEHLVIDGGAHNRGEGTTAQVARKLVTESGVNRG